MGFKNWGMFTCLREWLLLWHLAWSRLCALDPTEEASELNVGLRCSRPQQLDVHDVYERVWADVLSPGFEEGFAIRVCLFVWFGFFLFSPSATPNCVYWALIWPCPWEAAWIWKGRLPFSKITICLPLRFWRGLNKVMCMHSSWERSSELP